MAAQHRSAANPPDNPRKPRSRAQSFDKLLGRRIRERRILLGITQQDLADLIGVTYQQAYKYEKGINRIAGARLLEIAAALEWSIAKLLADLDRPPQPDRRLQRRVQVAADFARLSERHAAAVAELVRALADQGGEE